MTTTAIQSNWRLVEAEDGSRLDDLALALRLLERLGAGDESASAGETLARLRLCTSLWEGLHHEPCLAATLPLLMERRPADWAMACLRAIVEQDGDAWLESDGGPLLDWALDRHPIDALPSPQALVARRWAFVRPLALARALRQIDRAWPEVIAAYGPALAAQPDAVILLAGLADRLPPLLSALLEAGHADLAARALAANLPAAEVVARAHEMRFTAAHQVSLSRALAALGFEGHAAAVAHAEPTPPPITPPSDHVGGVAVALAERVNAALLTAGRGQHAEARHALAAAVKAARALTGALSATLADLAREGELASSEAAIRAAIETAPDNPTYLIRLAAVQLDAGRLDEALRTLAPVLAGCPDAEAHLIAARAHTALDDAPGGIEHARLALSLPHTGEQALMASRILAKAGDLKGAIAAAGRATAFKPWDSTAWVELGEHYRAGGDHRAASAAYAQAATLAPTAPGVRAALAECLAACDRPEEAERQFMVAAALAPGDARAAVGLARLALAASDPDKAAQIAREGLNHNPEDGALHDVLGAALEALDRTQEAVGHYAEATRLAPTLARPWLRLAAHQRANRQRDQARATLEAAAEAVPCDTRILADLADVYIAAGAYQLARDALARALTFAPADGRLLTRYGSVLRTLGHPREALGVLQAAADDSEGEARAEVAHEMALAYEAVGERGSALAAAQIAVEGRPDHTLYQITLGRVALAAGRADIAVDALNTALAATDADPDLYNLLGRAHRALGDARRAMDTHALALRMQPDNLDYQYDFALAARDAGQHEPAVVALREVVAERPDHAEAQLALGLSLEALRCWRDAYETLTTATALLPDDPTPYRAVGRVCMQLKNPESAITALGCALELDPDDVESYRLLGEAYSALGEVREAERAFHIVLERCPDDAGLHIVIGTALVELGAHAEAVPILERARALAPNDARVCSMLCQVYRALGQDESALEAARAAVALEPGSAAYHVMLGELLLPVDKPAAADAWTIALTLNPEDEGTRWRLVELCEALDRPGAALEVAEPLLVDKRADQALLQRATRWALAADNTEHAGYLIALALACDATDPALHALAAEVSLASGEPLRALAALRYAVELNPRDPAYRVRLAELLLGQNRPAEALEEAEQALALGVTSADHLLALGQLYNTMRLWSSALPLLMQVIERRREDPVAWLEIGQARVALAERAAQLADAGIARERLPRRDLRATLRVIERAISLGASGPSVTMLHGQAFSLLDDHAQAITLLEEAYRAAPSSLTRLALGVAHLRAGDLVAAERYLAPVSDQPHLEPSRLTALGTLYLARGDARAAFTALKEAATAAPGNPVAHYHLAQAAVALDRRATAVQALTQAIALISRAPAWHHQLGEQLLAMGHAPEAVAQFEQAAAMEPEDPDYLVSLGCALRAAGDLAGAVARFEEALRLAPDRADWWTELGALHEAHDVDGQTNQAAQSYKRALSLDEAHAPALLGLARVCQAAGRVDEAFAYAQRAAALAPEDADAQVILAECAARLDDVEQAAWHYERAAALSATPGPVLLALGRLYSQAEQWSKAVDALRRSIDAGPTDAAFATLARAYERLDQLEAAAEAAQNAAESAPERAAHWAYLGKLHRLLGQQDRALEYLEKAVARDRTDAETHREMGLVYEARGQYADALEAYQEAIRLAPDQAESYFRAGVVFKTVKDYRSAIKVFGQAVRLDPQNAEANRQFAAVSALGFVTSTPVE